MLDRRIWGFMIFHLTEMFPGNRSLWHYLELTGDYPNRCLRLIYALISKSIGDNYMYWNRSYRNASIIMKLICRCPTVKMLPFSESSNDRLSEVSTRKCSSDVSGDHLVCRSAHQPRFLVCPFRFILTTECRISTPISSLCGYMFDSINKYHLSRLFLCT